MHQEYPRHLHKPGGVYRVVENDQERDAALTDGWSLTPVVAGAVPEAPPVKAKTKDKAPKADKPAKAADTKAKASASKASVSHADHDPPNL